MIAQEASHEMIQCQMKTPSLANGQLEIAAAMADVRPDWMTAKA